MKLRNKKTGEVVDGTVWLKTEFHKEPWNCESIADLEEHWEDYKEPLIKDEKIRKAVRAWAEAQGLTELYLASNGYEIYGGIDDWVMQFKGEPFPFADKNEVYTIAELCGEEEE